MAQPPGDQSAGDHLERVSDLHQGIPGTKQAAESYPMHFCAGIPFKYLFIIMNRKTVNDVVLYVN